MSTAFSKFTSKCFNVNRASKLFIVVVTALSLSYCKTNESTCRASQFVLAGYESCNDNDPDSSYSISSLSKIGSYNSQDGSGGTAHTAFSSKHNLLYVANQVDNTLDAINISTPSSPSVSFSIDMSDYGTKINAVSVYSDTVAVAVENLVNERQQTGDVLLLNAEDGTVNNQFSVGYQPIHLAFNPAGTQVIVANAGEPKDDYTYDPEGSISVIDTSAKTVQTLGFTDFNTGGNRQSEVPDNLRIYGPNASVAQDLEPQHVAISSDNNYAYVTLQENNGVAKIDLSTLTITNFFALGTKDFNQSSNQIDVSDEDSGYNLNTQSGIVGLYSPDDIASYTVSNTQYFVTANEGVYRNYGGYSERERIGDISSNTLDSKFNFRLGNDDLGRLYVTTTEGKNSSNIYENLYTSGARSFSIWNSSGSLVYDSGDDFASNTQNANTYNDSQSDDHGTEPEALTVATLEEKTYAFVGLTYGGGFVIYDITTPTSVDYKLFVDNESTDTLVESLTFISSDDSPNNSPLLVVSYATSGTIAIYQISLSKD